MTGSGIRWEMDGLMLSWRQRRRKLQIRRCSSRFFLEERCPGWNDERTGGFCRLKPEHGIGAMYRSVQEGVLFNLYHCYQLLTEVNEEPQRIRLSGGILHSEMWTQMCADIFNREMEVDEVQQGSLMGAVVLAMGSDGNRKSGKFYCCSWADPSAGSEECGNLSEKIPAVSQLLSDGSVEQRNLRTVERCV